MPKLSPKDSEQPNKEIYGHVTIYAIEDPDNHKVFYVGQTKGNPKSRLQSHMREAKKYQEYTSSPADDVYGMSIQKLRAELDEIKIGGKKYNVRKCRWIINITDRGQYPALRILDEWDAPIKQDAHRLEEAWIAQMRSLGYPLTNYIYSHRMSPEWYSKSNKAWKEGWATSPAEYIEMLKSGKVGGHTTGTKRPSKRYTRSQMRRYSKRSIKNTSKSNKRKNNKRSRKRKPKR